MGSPKSQRNQAPTGTPDPVTLAEYDALRSRAVALAEALEIERQQRAAAEGRHQDERAGTFAQLEGALARLGEQTAEIGRLEQEVMTAQTEVQKLRFERRALAEKMDRDLRAKHAELVQALQDLATADREIDRLHHGVEARRAPMTSVPRTAS